jgi:signal transduction histidine kinase/DNA-binding response OmpR family regulator
MGKAGKTRIKLKVIVGYALIFIAIGVSGIIAYNSYNKLLDSVYSLSKPDDEILRMNRILTNLSEAENHIRIYSLTRQQKHLNNYVVRVESIQEELDSLKTLQPMHHLPISLVDSMRYLLEERSEKLTSFVKLKRAKEKINFSQKAIQELNRASDTIASEIRTTTTTTTVFDTVATPVVVKEKKKGILRRWFSKEKEVEKVDTQKTVVQRTLVKVDTSYVPQPDSLINNLKVILQDVRREELRNRRILSREELRLIDENAFILGKVKSILKRLEKKRLAHLTQKTEHARQIASDAIFTISIIIIVGIVLGSLFVFFILNDITRSNFYRKELIIAKGHAEKLAKVKEEFLATMSHEIRTPLNAVIGFSSQMDKTQLDKKQMSFLEAIKNSSSHLLGLVNEILDLSKIEAGKLKIEKLPFRPIELVEKVHELLNNAAEKKGLEFSWNFQGDQSIILVSDPFRLKQILLNLGSNAIKFTDAGSVQIQASVVPVAGNYELRVCVEDTGIGIEKEKLETIFEDFNQADSFSARKYGGTGLGLSISRRLARLLGGDLNVDSKYGFGSTFTMVLALEEADESEAVLQIEKELEIPEWLRGKHFLVADDDAYSLLLMETIFAGWNLKAEFVNDGKLALENWKEKEYDLVLTDIHMPGMGGLELCSRIRSDVDTKRSSMPVIALTANVREKDLKKYKATGMTNCLVKPFDESSLLKVLISSFGEEVEKYEIEEETQIVEQASSLYDLEEIKRFTADDSDLIVQILETFVEGAQQNLELLQKELEQKNYLKIGELAHKMLSSFNQLKVIQVVPLLQELEDLLHRKEHQTPDQQRVKVLVEEVINSTKPILERLKKDISDLSKS